MDAIRFGSPNLFVKGIAEQTFYDPATGNIIGYDNVANDSAITTSVNLSEITGGIGNVIVGIIPDTSRLSGTYTSQAFSLATRRMIVGGKLSYNANASVCETIRATGTTLTVTKEPVKHYGQPASDVNCWCFVREHGSTDWMGVNYGVDPVSKVVQGFTAVSGKDYDVQYWTKNASAQELAIPEMFRPTVATVQTKFGVYSMQNNEQTQSTLYGWLYVVVPRAILNGDAGISANQTTNATTNGNWTALPNTDSAPVCDDCSGSERSMAYYVLVPCGDASQAVKDLAVIGDGLTLAVNEAKHVPVKYWMPDGSVQQPDYTAMTYASAKTSIATVSNDGVVTGVSAGTTTVTATLGTHSVPVNVTVQ